MCVAEMFTDHTYFHGIGCENSEEFMLPFMRFPAVKGKRSARISVAPKLVWFALNDTLQRPLLSKSLYIY